jgi:hypothetical protein
MFDSSLAFYISILVAMPCRWQSGLPAVRENESTRICIDTTPRREARKIDAPRRTAQNGCCFGVQPRSLLKFPACDISHGGCVVSLREYSAGHQKD